MKVFLTGGAGFIGSHIAESLVQAGHYVAIYDNFSSGNYLNIKNLDNSKVKIIEGDILDYKKLHSSMSGYDFISHHAAQLEIYRAAEDPSYDLTVNTIGTLNVLKSAVANNITKMINVSSACVYGQTPNITDESAATNPNWTYGVSKLAAEKYCQIYSSQNNIKITNLRYGIVYGEKEWYRRVLTIFIKRAIEKKSLVIFDNGAQIRDFIYVGDVVKLNNICMHSKNAENRTFNVGTSIPTTIQELATIVQNVSKEIINYQPEIIYENLKEGAHSLHIPDKKRNISDLNRMQLGISKAELKLNWKPETTLVDGIKKEMLWYLNNISRWQKVTYSNSTQ